MSRSNHNPGTKAPFSFLAGILSLSLILLGCKLASRVANLLHTPTPTPTLTATFTPTYTLTFTPSPTPTLPPSPTATPTPTFTATFTPSPTPTITPIPATLTPGPNQITSGQDVWQLTALEMTHTVRFLNTYVSPQTYNNYPYNYVFLVFDFQCQTGTNLPTLYAGSDLGVTYVHKKTGYPDLYVTDSQDNKFPVTIISTCWLAAPVPYTSHGFTLHFQNLPLIKPTLPLSGP
jgi:hypothetical protein